MMDDIQIIILFDDSLILSSKFSYFHIISSFLEIIIPLTERILWSTMSMLLINNSNFTCNGNLFKFVHNYLLIFNYLMNNLRQKVLLCVKSRWNLFPGLIRNFRENWERVIIDSFRILKGIWNTNIIFVI